MRNIIKRQANDQELTDCLTWEIWESGDAKTFIFSYDQDVCFVVQEGESVINSKTNDPIFIKAGDHITIEAGVDAVWDISRPIINRYRYI